MDGGLDGLELVHELLVDMQAARSVEKHHVVAVILRVADGLLGDMDGIALPHLKDGDVELTADDLQLRDGGGTVHVAGHEQRALAELAAHEPRELGGVRRLTSALQADHHHDGGALGGGGDFRAGTAHELCQLLVDDLHHLLGRGETVEHVRADTALGDLRHEVLDDLVAHVGLEQGQTHLPHAGADVGLGQAALAAQAFEGLVQFFAQSLKCHGVTPLTTRRTRGCAPRARRAPNFHTGGS